MQDIEMQDIEKFNRLMREAHQIHRDIGWWSDPATGRPIDRNKGELLALVHTELAEAHEAYSTDSMDDKLPHRKGVEVELADACIRLGDYAGGFGYEVSLDITGGLDYIVICSPFKPSRTEVDFAHLHANCSFITEAERKYKNDIPAASTAKLLYGIFAVAIANRADLVGAIEEKMAFNKQRLDHKLEARAAADGKKF